MEQDVIGNWVEKAKYTKELSDAHEESRTQGVKVIRRPEPKTHGEVIMDIADKIWPSLMKLFANVRDESGMLMQPAHVRGIALNVAQDLIKNKQ